MSKFTQKGQKFLKFINSGKSITRQRAKARWRMGNPSAWVKYFEDNALVKVERSYERKIINGRLVRLVTYTKKEETV